MHIKKSYTREVLPDPKESLYLPLSFFSLEENLSQLLPRVCVCVCVCLFFLLPFFKASSGAHGERGDTHPRKKRSPRGRRRKKYGREDRGPVKTAGATGSPSLLAASNIPVAQYRPPPPPPDPLYASIVYAHIYILYHYYHAEGEREERGERERAAGSQPTTLVSRRLVLYFSSFFTSSRIWLSACVCAWKSTTTKTTTTTSGGSCRQSQPSQNFRPPAGIHFPLSLSFYISRFVRSYSIGIYAYVRPREDGTGRGGGFNWQWIPHCWTRYTRGATHVSVYTHTQDSLGDSRNVYLSPLKSRLYAQRQREGERDLKRSHDNVK